MKAFNGLCSHKKFTPFFWVQFLGAFNDNVIKNMLVILVAYQGVELMGLGSDSLIAMAGAIFIFPFVVFSPLAGRWADHYSKVHIMKLTKVAELLIMLLATFGLYSNNYYILFLCLFLMGMQSTFFGPVKYSIIPSLIKPKELVQANALVELGTFLAILLGTIVGGLLSKNNYWVVPGLILCLVSGLGLLASTFQPSDKFTAGLQKPTKFSKMSGAGFKDLYSQLIQQPNMLSSVLAISCFWFFGAGLLTVLPSYCQKSLNVNQDVVTLFLAMFTVGIGVGSMACSFLSRQKVELGLAPLGFLGVLVFVIDFYFANLGGWVGEGRVGLKSFLLQPSSLRVLLDFFLISFFGGIFIVPLYAYIQENSAYSKLSRVIAANNIMNAIFMVFVSVVILLFNFWGWSPALVLLAVAILFFIFSFLIFVFNSEFRTISISYWLKKINHRP